VPGIDRLEGVGVYYGSALTEALSCQGDEVYIVGGANSAGQAAIHLARFARKVTILVRGPSLAQSMSQYLIDQIGETQNIVVRPCTQVVEVSGTESLESITIADSRTTAVDDRRPVDDQVPVDDRLPVETVPAKGLFVFIGAQPYTDWVAGVLERDAYGFILSGPNLMRDAKPPKGWDLPRDPFLLETSVPGVFVAGDVRSGSVKRVASAVGEGSIAVMFIHQHLSKV
jgi:thioredoxin reductase (NADPH)